MWLLIRASLVIWLFKLELAMGELLQPTEMII